MSKSLLVYAACLATVAFGIPSRLLADQVYFGPVPYLSSADVPVGFYDTPGNTPDFLEDFEDGLVDPRISPNRGTLISNTPSGATDSVDGDDGSIDGSGAAGSSWLYVTGGNDDSITFTFNTPLLPTAAGLAWTDGPNDSILMSFEGFGPNGNSLGIFGPFSHADDNILGGTAEDRFYGVQNAAGISAIRMINSSGSGMEVDHIQFGGQAVPEPSSVGLLVLGCCGFLARFRRRTKPAFTV